MLLYYYYNILEIGADWHGYTVDYRYSRSIGATVEYRWFRSIASSVVTESRQSKSTHETIVSVPSPTPLRRATTLTFISFVARSPSFFTQSQSQSMQQQQTNKDQRPSDIRSHGQHVFTQVILAFANCRNHEDKTITTGSRGAGSTAASRLLLFAGSFHATRDPP